MPVGEHLVEAARRLRRADPADLTNGRRVREAGDIEHDGADLVVRTSARKLTALLVVVAAFPLKTLPAQAPPAPAGLVQLRILDPPFVKNPGTSGVLHADDRESR